MSLQDRMIRVEELAKIKDALGIGSWEEAMSESKQILAEAVARIKGRCERYWNESRILPEEVHAVLENIWLEADALLAQSGEQGGITHGRLQHDRIESIRDKAKEIDLLCSVLTGREPVIFAPAARPVEVQLETESVSNRMQTIMSGDGHPDEGPCVVCGEVFDTHAEGCIFDMKEQAEAGMPKGGKPTKKHIDFKIQSFSDGVWMSHAVWRRIKKFLEDHDLTVDEGEKK